jgi:hypothetical protein
VSGGPSPPSAKRAEPTSQQESLGPGWIHVVRGGLVVKAAIPLSPNPLLNQSLKALLGTI